jgi:hypothetical protein
MLGLTAGASAAAAAPVMGVLALVELAFSSGTLRLTNYPLDVTILGATWTGVGAVGAVDEIRESEDGAGEKLTIGLSQVPSGYLAAALGSVETYQGRDARVYVAMLDGSTLQVTGSPRLRFAGYMDRVHIERGDDGVGKVLVDLVTFSGDARANPSGLRLANAQHQAEHPGERGFEYLTDLVGKPALWLSKTFQQI